MRSSAVTEHYEKLLTTIYQEIKAQGREPQNGWKVSYQPEYGTTTWTLTEDKAKGRTGTNGELVVKLFTPGSYDFVKTEDYLTRGRALFEASNQLLESYCENNPTLKKQLNNWMKQSLASFEKEI